MQGKEHALVHILNPIMRRDPDVDQMALMDITGGSVVFFNTRARLEKVTANA
jgi:tetrathionate reductase subunit A